MHICRWMDYLYTNTSQYIAFIGTTNRPNAVDNRLRRGGRLEQELVLLSTSTRDRYVLISEILNHWRLIGLENAQEGMEKEKLKIVWLSDIISQMTGGYVCADIYKLCETALHMYTSTVMPVLSYDQLLYCFKSCMKQVTPSCLRGITVSVQSNVSIQIH